MELVNELIDRGLVPGPALRLGVRLVLRERLAEQEEIYGRGAVDRAAALERWIARMREAPIALVPDQANAQHYEVPAAFFALCLGARRKYSCAYYPGASEPLRARRELDAAEDAMLALTVERAGLEEGMDILELGCGWGSLSLYMAERFPHARIVAVSNSSSQRAYIEAEAARRGLDGLEVITADMNDFEGLGGARFDRVVSVEMFEHMRNWERLLARIRTWVRAEGRVFLHVFAHARFSYPYEDAGPSDWMTRHFFAGGMMPSHDLLDHLDIPFALARRWQVDGRHYARTSEAWLARHEAHEAEILRLFAATYGGPEQARVWFQRWRLFFIAVAEFFAHDRGQAWFVSHNLLRPL